MNETLTSVPVDIHNNFVYKDCSYQIDSKLKQYKVENKPIQKEDGKWNNWLNLTTMDSVIVIQHQEGIHFCDQKGEEITKFVSIYK